MRGLEVFGVLFLIGSLLVTPVALTYRWLFAPTPDPWVVKQAQRCHAYKGRLEKVSEDKLQCWRTPFMRHPKKMFTAER